MLSTQAWTRLIAIQLGTLGLEPVLTCPGDGAEGLVEDRSWARGVGNWDPTKMEPSPNPTAVSLFKSATGNQFIIENRENSGLVGNGLFFIGY